MSTQTIYTNGRIYTMTGEGTTVPSLVAKEGKIVAVGTYEELRKQYPQAQEKDLEGHVLFPGFIDGHSHIITSGYEKMFANANPSPKGNCDSMEQLVEEMQKAFAQWEKTKTEGQWFIGMGYENAVYENNNHPTKLDLDKVSTQEPICIMHSSGHCAVFNSKALEICGITKDYKIPEGGNMPRLPHSEEFSGVLQEKAFFAQTRFMKTPDREGLLAGIKKAVEEYLFYGITTAQDAKTTAEELSLLETGKQTGLFPMDVVSYVDPSITEQVLPKQNPKKNPYDRHVRFGGYKLFLDGSPQAKTAWLTEPYYKIPEGEAQDYKGFPSLPDEAVEEQLKTCLKNHWQVNVHTNGDAAIDQLIRCYKKAMEAYPDRENLRPVSIHCQTVREDQLEEMKDIGMCISFFSDHVFYWGDYHYESVLGPERAERISPLQSALKREIPFTFHQDTPVVAPNMMFAVHNAVNRKTRKGRTLGAQYAISTYEAMEAITVNGAYQIFEEDQKGTIEVGKKADFTLLEKDPFKVDKEELKDIAVLETIKEDCVIYRRA